MNAVIPGIYRYEGPIGIVNKRKKTELPHLTDNPVFLVLPTLIVLNEKNYIILEPIVGKYTIQEVGENEMYHFQLVQRISGKLVFIDHSLQSGNMTIHEIQGKSITPTKIRICESILTNLLFPSIVCADEHPVTFLNNNLEVITSNIKTPKSFIVANNTIVECKNAIPSCELVYGSTFMSIGHGPVRLYEHDLGFCGKPYTDLKNVNLKYTSEKLFDQVLALHHLMRINERQITGKYAENYYMIDFDLQEEVLFKDVTNIQQLCDGLWTVEFESVCYLYLVGEKILPISQNESKYISCQNIGLNLARLFMDEQGSYRVHRVHENPFKTKERDRLANWLYETLEKILPLAITGIITEYCTLVRYYDYDVLMNYMREQESGVRDI